MNFKTGIFSLSFLILVAAFLMSGRTNDGVVEGYTKVVAEMSVEDVLLKLGEKKPNHYIKQLNTDSAKIGFELVTTGYTKRANNKRQSKFFVCTDCHNLVPEVYNLADESPAARLKYSKEKDIPFLPASTFYGMYNKEHWYNGDYAKKYGALVAPTRDSLVNAIQLCAIQCSQGRLLENWELRSVLHYMKSIAFELKDLILTSKDVDRLTEYVINKDKGGIKLLKSKYNQINEATFDDTKVPTVANYKANSENGKHIFNNGCLHCHGTGTNVASFEFNDDNLTLDFLESQISKHNHFSVPYLVRKGTYAIAGKKQYMPQYSLQKMSREQLLDLLSYISLNKSN